MLAQEVNLRATEIRVGQDKLTQGNLGKARFTKFGKDIRNAYIAREYIGVEIILVISFGKASDFGLELGFGVVV